MATDLTLNELVERARTYKMTPSERRAHQVSLIMGLRSYKSTLTRERVESFLEEDAEGTESES